MIFLSREIFFRIATDIVSSSCIRGSCYQTWTACEPGQPVDNTEYPPHIGMFMWRENGL